MLHFSITEDSANVQDVTERAREGFTESTLVLVQANGLRIENNAVTRGNAKHKNNTYYVYVYVYVYMYIYVCMYMFIYIVFIFVKTK